MIREQVFVNGGELYEGDVVDNYVTDLDADPIFTFYQNTDNGKKEYRSSSEFRKWLLDYESVHTLDYNDVCPDVTLWLGKAYFSNAYTEEECYFKVDDSAMLKKVSDYYSLPYPITNEVEVKLDSTPEVISAYVKGSEHVVVGSIKYLNGSATHLVFKSDKKTYREKRIDDGGDPITQWEGVITETSKIEHYESSKEMREIIGNLSTGSNYEDRDRCPSVNLWVGRSWIEDEQETLYFYAENSEMVDAVATYYSLPQPYDAEVKQQLDENPEIMRFKSYDIYNKGEGNFTALVVAGIVFESNSPTMLKLYELKRWNE